MSVELISKETVFSDDLFAIDKGRVQFNTEAQSAPEGWQRIFSLCPRRGVLFVASIYNDAPGVSIYKAQSLLEIAEVTEIVPAPRASEWIETTSKVNVISISPQEKYVAFCLDNALMLVYSISRILSNAATTPVRQFSFEKRVHDVVWRQDEVLVCVLSKGKALQVSLKGNVKSWSCCERVIALDVIDACSVWVPYDQRSQIFFSDGVSVDLESVMDASEDQIIVNGVKLLKDGMMVASVVKWSETSKERKELMLVIVKWSGSKVSIFPESLASKMNPMIENVDPVLTCPLLVCAIPGWSCWLVSSSELGDIVHRVVLNDACEFLVPVEFISWPLKKSDEDQMIMGMGVGSSIQTKIPSQQSPAEQRVAKLTVSATEDGTLLFSVIAHESTAEETTTEEELEEETEEELEEETEEELEEETEEELEKETEEELEEETPKETRFSRSAVPSRAEQMRRNPVFDQKMTPPLNFAEETERKREEEVTVCSQEATKTESQEQYFFAALVQDFERRRLDHIQNFRHMKRLIEMTKSLKLRILDVFLEVRQMIQKLEENEVDPVLQQQGQYLHKIRRKVICGFQVLNKVQFVLKNDGDRLKYAIDAESTMRALQEEKEFSKSKAFPKIDKPATNLEDWLDGCVADMLNMDIPEKQDLSPELRSHRFQTIKTKVQLLPVEASTTPRMWKMVSIEDIPWKEMNLISYVPDIRPQQSSDYILHRFRTPEGSIELEWIPQRELEKCVRKPIDQEDGDDGSLSSEFEICSEDEIEKILEQQNVEGKVASVSAKEERNVNQRMTKEEERQEALYSHILQTSLASNKKPTRNSIVQLKTKIPPPTLKEFLTNLGREDEFQQEETQTEVSKADTLTATTVVMTASMPTTVVNNQNSLPATLMEQPRPILSPAPQLGILGNVPPGVSSVSNASEGFGAFARTRNIFGNIAQAQETNPSASSSSLFTPPNPQPSLMMPLAFNPGNKPMNPDLFKMRK